MYAEELLQRLDSVKKTGRGYTARCPAHSDKTPSLSVREGERGLLVRCWAGCTLKEVTGALGIRIADLFADTITPSTGYRARMQRTHERQRKAHHDEVDGFAIDALREADYFVRSRQGLDISPWTHDDLNDELDALADAHALLWAEELAQWT